MIYALLIMYFAEVKLRMDSGEEAKFIPGHGHGHEHWHMPGHGHGPRHGRLDGQLKNGAMSEAGVREPRRNVGMGSSSP